MIVIISLQIIIPDDATPNEVATYLREQSDNAAGQIEQDIIRVPEIDETILIDIHELKTACGQVEFITHEASIFRSK